jgi:CRP/FNR family cyclic AMP-dependent transcriptional regulator
MRVIVAVPTLDLTALGELDLFDGVERADLERLSAMLHRSQVAAGAMLMLEEQPAESAYLIASGTVRVFVTQLDGTEVTLSLLGPGDLIGEIALLDSLGRSASVITIEPTSLYWMDRGVFLGCVRTVPVVAHNLMRIMARRLRLMNARVRALAALDVEGRVAYILLGLAREYGAPGPGGDVRIPLRLTQSDLAGLAGASRVRINQVIGSLKRRNIVAVDRRSCITVRQLASLEQYAR